MALKPTFNDVHIDLTPQEIEKIKAVTEFIATQKSVSAAKIKLIFGLSDVEYEILMELAMPLIRALSTGEQWKRIYTNHLRKLDRLIDKPHDHPMGKRSVMSWADDPVLRLDRLEREIRADYNEAFKSGLPVDHLLKMGLDGEEYDA